MPITARSSTELERPIRVGIFDTIEAADQAVADLLDAGFSKNQITVICSDKIREAHFREFEHQDPAGAHADKASVAGGAIGAVLGGLSVLTGIIASGGLGLLATGAIAAAGGGVTGTFVGAMMTRGVEKELADFYDQAVVRGKILVAAEAHGPDRHELLALASRIFAQAGALPVAIPEAPV